MATTVYGKIDCYIDLSGANPNNHHNLVNETYTQAYNFLEYLQTQNVVELYAMFTGSGATGTGVGFWDDPTNRFGISPFSVWRFKPNPSSNRNWDWYLMLQSMSGSTALDTAPINARPTRTDDNVSSLANTPVCLLIANAFALDATGSSITPWGGIANVSGSAYKGTNVWTSGSLTGSQVFVVPRNNNSAGTFTTNKQNTIVFTRLNTSAVITNVKARNHFFCDGDSFLMLQNVASSNGGSAILANTYNAFYCGAYSMLDAISKSNPTKTLGPAGPYGFIAFNTKNESDVSTTYPAATSTLVLETNLGNVVAAVSTVQGAVFANSDIGMRRCQLSYGNYNTTTYATNKLISTGSVYMEHPICVISSEDNSSFGVAGWLNTPLIRGIIGLQTHDTRADGLRAVFGGSAVTTNQMITTPWSGSNPPGTNFTRNGITFKINNYTV